MDNPKARLLPGIQLILGPFKGGLGCRDLGFRV